MFRYLYVSSSVTPTIVVLLLLFRQPHSGYSRVFSAQTPGLDDYITEEKETGQKDGASSRVSG